ncbi:MAG: hypothetical protein IT209_00355 [Armatimonadetes bacterium]|nr:hypothetical protein [Armatimonadota bacterium]
MKSALYLLMLVMWLHPFAALSQTEIRHDNAQWKLVWSDDFQRDEVGLEWKAVNGEISIENGRLHLTGSGVFAIIDRGFKPDVRLEFDAEADPRYPPVDLSAGLAASSEYGYRYLLAFGGQNNRVNQIVGPGFSVVDQHPKVLIRQGETYHISATKEGRELTLRVNGKVLVHATVRDPLGGPGFDRAGIVTWAGLYADNVRVYERVTPAAGTPEYLESLPRLPISREGRELALDSPGDGPAWASAAIDKFNRGQIADALHDFQAHADTLIGMAGWSYVAGDLRFQESDRTGELAEVARAWQRLLSKSPENPAISALATASGWFADLKMARSGKISASRLVALGRENNPFYYKALLYKARYRYWDGKEGGNNEVVGEAVGWMRDLKKLWPENVILREYTGETIPWGEELNADTQRHPAWAAYLHEAYARQVRLMDVWFEKRQAPDGQLGGGWGDDVELMRTWMQIAAISTGATQAQAGIEKLADGVWKSVLKDGFDKVGDVEHSAEPSADTLPTMLFLRYGDPLWVERNMRSCKTIIERFLGIDAKGYPRFKSSEYGWNGVHTQPQAGGDTGYNARTMKHLIWQAWQGDPVARDWFLRWCKGWAAATSSKSDTKLPGLPPESLWYPSGSISPPGGYPWWDQKRNYYGQMGTMIHDAILCAYALSGDRTFLKPFQLLMDGATLGPLPSGNPAPGTVEYCNLAMASMADPNKTALYRYLTGERVYDEYTRRFGDPAQIYRTDYNLDRYMRSFQRTAEANRTNLELQTTEVLSTDRAALNNALTVFGAYTGAVEGLRDASTPTFAVTYVTPDTGFAALVTESTPQRLRIRMYSFWKETKKIALRPWLLKPGTYILMTGRVLGGEHAGQHRYAWGPRQKMKILHRAQPVYVELPPGKEYEIDLRLDEAATIPVKAPDLAIATRDIQVRGQKLYITVHNIGNAPSSAFRVALEQQSGGAWKQLSSHPVKALASPRNLTLSTVVVSLPLPEGASRSHLRVRLDPDDAVFERDEENNTAAISAG